MYVLNSWSLHSDVMLSIFLIAIFAIGCIAGHFIESGTSLRLTVMLYGCGIYLYSIATHPVECMKKYVKDPEKYVYSVVIYANSDYYAVFDKYKDDIINYHVASNRMDIVLHPEELEKINKMLGNK